MQIELLLLRIIHVVGAVIWVGSGVFMGFFLAPTIAQMGPTGGQVMAGLQKRKLMTILPIVAILTILSGARLMMIVSGNFGPGYFRTPMGRAFSAAALAGVLAFVIGIVMNRPIAMKMAKLQTAVSSDPASKEAIAAEIKKLQSRAMMTGVVVMALLLLAAIGMSVARYL